jgi:hypothetical protein
MFILICCLSFNCTNLSAQKSIYSGEDIKLKVKTTGRLLSPNKLILVVSIDIPRGWKLKVDQGYESMWQDGIDTVDMTLKFRKNQNCQIVERLKADRRPSIHGYYYEDVTFAQTLRINSKNLPLFIDAELNLSLVRNDEKDFVNASPCCLLEVCQKRSASKTLKIGWDCERREKVYLEDVMD